MSSSTIVQPGKLTEVVASVLRSRIREFFWRAGDKIPSHDELAQEFSVSLITIRQALTILERDGWIKRKQGVGTFVSWFRNPGDDLVIKLDASLGMTLHALDEIGIQMIESGPADGMRILEADEGAPAGSYQRIRRLHSSQSKPFAIVDIYLDRKIFARAPERFKSARVLHVMDSLRVRIAQARQFMRIGVADIEAAKLLSIPLGTPVGCLRRVLTDDKGIVVLVANIIYPGDLVRLEVTS